MERYRHLRNVHDNKMADGGTACDVICGLQIDGPLIPHRSRVQLQTHLFD